MKFRPLLVQFNSQALPAPRLWMSVASVAFVFLIAGCTAPSIRKLSPAAYARFDKSIREMQTELEIANANAVQLRNEAKRRGDLQELRDQLDILRETPANSTELPNLTNRRNDPARLQPFATQWMGKSEAELAAARTELSIRIAAVEHASKGADLAEDQAARLAAATNEVVGAKKDGVTTATTGDLFISFVPIIAFRGGLNSTAIAAVAVNAQPFDFGSPALDLLGVQAVFGGALNPDADASGPSAAVGAGLWYPIGSTGAISVGGVLWQVDDDTRSGVYIGLNLGQERKKAPTDG
jgi:hypothetical protein